MNARPSDLPGFTYVLPDERLEFQAFRWGLATGFVIGLGSGLIVFVAAAWVFA